MACRHGRGRALRALAVACWVVLVPALAGCPSTTQTAGKPPPPVPPPPVPKPVYFVHEVQKGDTLYSLGRRFGVSPGEIARDNEITAPRELAVGTPLTIRRVAGAEAPPALSAAPVVQRRPVDVAALQRGKPSAQFWWPTVGPLARHYKDPLRGMPEPGIAISTSLGTEVCAVADGTVVSCVRGGDAPDSAWGNVVAIAHAGGMASWYGHLASVFVKEGSRVRKGEPIGTVGSTGAVRTPTLAFRLYRDHRPVNPLDYLP